MFAALLSLYFSNILNTQPAMMEPNGTAAYKEILTASPMPIKKQEGEPNVQASSALVLDISSGNILWQKEIDSRRQIASITKLMTALVVLEENNLNDVVTVSANASGIEGSKIWIYGGEKLTVGDLLTAALIHSANDAAYALAEFNAGSIPKFVEKMNKKAEQLGLKNTHFSNPIGFDGPDNYSTARDMSILGRYAYRNSFIRKVVAISETEVKSLRGTKFKLESTNGLLKKDPRFKGLKTGHTTEAGYSFVGIAEIDGVYPVMIIVFNSPNRFQESVDLLNWAVEHYKW